MAPTADAADPAITFSEYPVGTVITNQYASLGIIFSGGSSAGSPFITTDASNPTSPVLSGSPLFNGPIQGSFVDANGKPATVTQFQLDAGYFDDLGSTQLTWFDSSGNVIGSQTNSELGIETFTIQVTANQSPIASWIIQEIGAEAAGFAIDNVSFPTPTSGLIIMPSENQEFSLSSNNSTGTDPISFLAQTNGDALTKWTVKLQYQPASGRTFSGPSMTFDTPPGSTQTETYTGVGGQLTVNAKQGPTTGSVTATITGVSIPNGTITSELVTLYDGATPNLMTGIAERESSYLQFTQSMLYNQTALWPTLSSDASHVGLMQVVTNMDHAFDWVDNAAFAVSLFADKLGAASRNGSKIQASHDGLVDLTDIQLENMAVLLYGPWAPRANQLQSQYYIPVCSGGTVKGKACNGGNWVWSVNTGGNPNGVAYVNYVRSNLQ